MIDKRFKHSEYRQDDGQLICYGIEDSFVGFVYNVVGDGMYDVSEKKLIKLLNELNDENKQLKHNNKMLSMKMSEVYTKYCLLKEFSEDTNPNDAVKRILSELMQITKEYR